MDIFPDGKRFVITAPAGGESDDRAQIRVALGFFEELKRLAPANGGR